MRSAAPYEKLKAWQVAHQLAIEVYFIARRLPSPEKFDLGSQARRAAFSVPANIAEGIARRGSREFRRFLDVSLGSLGELRYALRFFRDVRLISTDEWNRLEALRTRAGYLTWRLYQSVSADTKKRR